MGLTILQTSSFFLDLFLLTFVLSSISPGEVDVSVLYEVCLGSLLLLLLHSLFCFISADLIPIAYVDFIELQGTLILGAVFSLIRESFLHCYDLL